MLGIISLHQSIFALSVDSICSFLPLQMGRASRIYFCGKHNPLLLLQYCYQDRKWARDREQVKTNSSLSFPLCSSTHTLPAWDLERLFANLYFNLLNTGFVSQVVPEVRTWEMKVSQQTRALSCASCLQTAGRDLHLQPDPAQDSTDSIIVPSYPLPKLSQDLRA